MSSDRPPPPRGGPRGPLWFGAAAKASSESSACPDPCWFGGTGLFPFLPLLFLGGGIGLDVAALRGCIVLALARLVVEDGTNNLLAGGVVGCGVEQLIGVGGSASRKPMHQVPARRTLEESVDY